MVAQEPPQVHPQLKPALAQRVPSSTALVPSPASRTIASESSLAALGKDVLAGASSGIAITFVGHPLDTIKTRLQAQSGSRPLYTGTWDCARATFRHEGVRGLYKVLLNSHVR